MINKKISVAAIALLLTFTAGLTRAGDPSADEGKALFQARCASCHSVNRQLIGPALAGVEQRHSEAWIIQFVKSSQGMVKSGNKEAVTLFNQFQLVMPDHPDLSDDQVRGILSYIRSAAADKGADQAPFARPAVARPGYLPLSFTDPAFLVYLFMIPVLIMVLLMAVKASDLQKKGSGRE
ncbi:cytochrome c [Compostibacter hankyongensis]|uniref:Cytochrome c domain-containing protein n=1 Tax=Compostibacter hankyongensis TaxID=1007089 RepID=A0ABP8FWJ7_9BACT